jgi:hypothetical protein
MTGARWSSAQTSRLNSMISRIGEVATTEAVRKPPIATSGGSDQSGGEISTAISPTTSPAPIVPTVSPLMTTSAVPLSMAYSEYPTPPSAASNCPGGISASDAMLATAASSSSGKSAKKRIAASRDVSILPRLHSGSYLRDLAPRPLLRAASSSPGAWAPAAPRTRPPACPVPPAALGSRAGDRHDAAGDRACLLYGRGRRRAKRQLALSSGHRFVVRARRPGAR